MFFYQAIDSASSSGLFGTGVTVAMDPRTLGTQIDDSIMDKSLDTRIILIDKKYIVDVKTKVLDGRIFITGKVDTPEEKLKITKIAWETEGVRSVRNDLVKSKKNLNLNNQQKTFLLLLAIKISNYI